MPPVQLAADGGRSTQGELPGACPLTLCWELEDEREGQSQALARPLTGARPPEKGHWVRCWSHTLGPDAPVPPSAPSHPAFVKLAG